MTIGGPGFPQPETPETAARKRLAGGGVDLSAGKDLTHLISPEKFQHRWILIGNYLVDPKGMAELQKAVEAAEAAARAGEQPGGVQIPYGPETLIGMDGPGCAKCGIAWQTEGKGYGHPCPVSDDQYDPQHIVTPPPGGVKIPPNLTWEQVASLMHQGISEMAKWVVTDEEPMTFLRQVAEGIQQVIDQVDAIYDDARNLGSDPAAGDPLEALLNDGD